MPLNQTDVQDWLERHIPHRVRSSIARMPRLWRQIGDVYDWKVINGAEKIARRCETDAIWEGRLVATRWLVELVGLTRDKNGNPIRKPRNSNNTSDVLLDDLPGGVLIPPTSSEAQKLSLVWKGCAQGSSHPTNNSGHPPVNESELSIATDIIIDHLQKTVYATANKDVLQLSLQPPP